MSFKKGDKLKLPLGETGTLVRVNDVPWGHRFIVRIRKGVFNSTNQHVGFKEEQLSLENPLAQINTLLAEKGYLGITEPSYIKEWLRSNGIDCWVEPFLSALPKTYIGKTQYRGDVDYSGNVKFPNYHLAEQYSIINGLKLVKE